MLKKLFSKFGKKDKFFLELKEDAAKVVEQAEKAIEKTTDTIVQVIEDKTEAAKDATKAAVSDAKHAEPVKAALAATQPVKAALAEATQTKEKKEKRSFFGRKKDPAKAKEAKAVEAKPKAEPKPAPEPTTTSQNGKVDPQDVAFASKYPVASTMSRRQPGPSLNVFKEMARQAKVPKKKG